MKKIKLIKLASIFIIVFMWIIPFKTIKAQTNDTIYILPQYPSINDTVFLVNRTAYSGGGAPLDSISVIIENYEIDVHFYYTSYDHHGLGPSTDTIEIGVLPAGSYFLSLTVRIYDADSGEYIEADETVEFTVTDEAGFQEQNKKSINIYPNPANQTIKP